MARNVGTTPSVPGGKPGGAGESGVYDVTPATEGYVKEGYTKETHRKGEKSPTLDRLGDFMKNELSAVETYDLALKSIRDPEFSASLRNLRDSHDKRVGLIRDKIMAWGGDPPKSSGAWGTFAKVVQRGADLFGDRTAIAALEEGEDRGIKMYEKDLDELDPATRDFVTMELLPEQRNTHALCRSLERFAKAS